MLNDEEFCQNDHTEAPRNDALTSIGVHGTTGDQAALNKFVRVTSHNLAILAVERN